MHSVTIIIGSLFFLYFARITAWRVVPAHQASYAQRAQDAGLNTRMSVIDKDDDEYLPRNSLHTVYKFGWCKHDVVTQANLAKTTNYSIPHRYAATSQWVYILDSDNIRRFKLQCVVVKVYVPSKYQFKRTRIPFYYCQGTVIYLMMRTVARILIHEFYFMAQFYMPATFVFEYYLPIYM